MFRLDLLVSEDLFEGCPTLAMLAATVSLRSKTWSAGRMLDRNAIGCSGASLWPRGRDETNDRLVVAAQTRIEVHEAAAAKTLTGLTPLLGNAVAPS